MKPETRQEIAQRLVVEAEGLVARQQQLVVELEKKGCETQFSVELLIQFERASANFRHTLYLLESTKL